MKITEYERISPNYHQTIYSIHKSSSIIRQPTRPFSNHQTAKSLRRKSLKKKKHRRTQNAKPATKNFSFWARLFTRTLQLIEFEHLYDRCFYYRRMYALQLPLLTAFESYAVCSRWPRALNLAVTVVAF